MSPATAQRASEDSGTGRRTPAHAAEPPRTAAGSWPLLRFGLRRDRIRLPLWVAGVAALVGIQSTGSQATYDTPGALESYARTAASSAAVVAMTGRPVGLDSIPRAVAFEIFVTTAVVVGLMSLFTVVRHTRADEEAGRTELVRSARVGRRAPLLAALLLAVLANVTVALAVWAVGIGTGLPAVGSMLLGASLAAFGLVLAAATAVAAQVSQHARAAAGLGGAAIGLTVVLRAIGDVQDNALSWLSPMGWAQATYPFHLDRWWPLLLCLALALVLSLLAVLLLDRRDHDAGLLGARPGPAAADRRLGTPLGLAWRLQRGTWLGWTLGVVVTGLAFGSLVQATETLLEGTPDAVEDMPIDPARFTDSFLALTVSMLSLLAGALAVQAALRARSEEQAGRAEPVLATATSRWSWAGSHVAVALLGSAVALLLGGLGTGLMAVATGTSGGADLVGDVTLSALLHVPAVWVLVGTATLLWGLSSRLAPLAWALFGWTAVVLLLAEPLDLPEWARWASPLHHVPAVPLEDPDVGGPLALLAVAGLLIVTGLAVWRRRDLATG